MGLMMRHQASDVAFTNRAPLGAGHTHPLCETLVVHRVPTLGEVRSRCFQADCAFPSVWG
jgi:hypothetical protein